MGGISPAGVGKYASTDPQIWIWPQDVIWNLQFWWHQCYVNTDSFFSVSRLSYWYCACWCHPLLKNERHWEIKYSWKIHAIWVILPIRSHLPWLFHHFGWLFQPPTSTYGPSRFGRRYWDANLVESIDLFTDAFANLLRVVGFLVATCGQPTRITCVMKCCI